jgi:cell wall-associated NlpC family hydrolase
MSDFEYGHLLGLTYVSGQSDCYSILRTYCRERYGLVFPNYARPERFWEDSRLDLYGMYASHGFVSAQDSNPQLGDVLLMPIRTEMVSHAAIVVEEGKILHHLPGRLSTLDSLRPRWASMATMIVRHPLITAVHQTEMKPVSFHEVVNARILQHPDVQAALATTLATDN